MAYQPPFTITSKILNLVAEISESLGRISAIESSSVKLRRINQIRSIQGSLAIEGNTLSIEQITAVLDGKPVIAPPKEIQEAKNALIAYEKMPYWNPLDEQDLCQAHQSLMYGLVDELGRYRSGGVGVMSGDEVIHMAPPAHKLPQLMHDLLDWLERTDYHPLIASSIFHYEFEFIHPFVDGNGRMGRLWQSLILSRWNILFLNLPVESLIHQHQLEYYQAINQSTQQTDCSVFVEFMLTQLNLALSEQVNTPQETPQETPQAGLDIESRFAGFIEYCQTPRNRAELQEFCGLQDREHFRLSVLKPLIEAGVLKLTLPDKPTSPKQKYYCEMRSEAKS